MPTSCRLGVLPKLAPCISMFLTRLRRLKGDVVWPVATASRASRKFEDLNDRPVSL